MARNTTRWVESPYKSTTFETDRRNNNTISISSSEDNDSDRPPSGAAVFSSSFPPHSSTGRPLINFVKNNWDAARSTPSRSTPSSSSSSSSSASSIDWHHVPGLRYIAMIVSAPKLRRYLITYAILLLGAYVGWEAVLRPKIQEYEDLTTSLDTVTMQRVGGWFGTNVRPEFADIVPMRSLDPGLLPSFEKQEKSKSGRRLVVVGDVHGCQDELEKLLNKVSFNPASGDHLILTGDMINKGPKSGGVVDLARKLGASCVRGNHEDRILLERSNMQLRNNESPEKENPVVTDPSDHKLARSLTDEQAAWLQECPVILKVGQFKDMGEVVVVHGGLVPGVPLERQELSSVMSMRTIDLYTHVPSASKDGTPWFKLYNQYVKSLASAQDKQTPTPVTVVYGHDAGNSLNIREYTKGLDSGCVYGRKLSALVIEDGGKNNVVQVKCKEYVKT